MKRERKLTDFHPGMRVYDTFFESHATVEFVGKAYVYIKRDGHEFPEPQHPRHLEKSNEPTPTSNS